MRRNGIIVLLLLALVLSDPLRCSSFPFPFFTNYQTLFSLSHSLFSRVANLREARGDFDGAARARSIALKLDNVSFWKFMWNLGWDYARNYAWRGTTPSFEMLSELNEILSGLTQFSRVRSDRDRIVWINRNYENLLRLSKSLFRRFGNVFRQSGPLKEVIETLQKEVVEGDLLRDCLEVGSNDLKGLIIIFKDISSKYTTTSSNRADL